MVRIAPIAAVVLTAAAIPPAAAQAQKINVKIAGKSDAEVQIDIRRAVREVCAAPDDFVFGVPQSSEVPQCERLTERKATAQLRRTVADRAASNRIAAVTPQNNANAH